MFQRVHLLSAGIACALSLAAAAANATTYDFSTAYDSGSPNPSGTTYTSLTLNGATFTASGASSTNFTVGPNGGLYSTLGSSVLSTAGSDQTVNIAFSTAQNGISFDAANGDIFQSNGSDTVTVNEYNAGKFVGTQSIVPVIPAGSGDYYPQGFFTLAAGAAAFTSVSISAADAAGSESLAIAELVTTPVPLPAAIWMLLSGLGGAMGFVRRRARAAAV